MTAMRQRWRDGIINDETVMGQTWQRYNSNECGDDDVVDARHHRRHDDALTGWTQRWNRSTCRSTTTTTMRPPQVHEGSATKVRRKPPGRAMAAHWLDDRSVEAGWRKPRDSALTEPRQRNNADTTSSRRQRNNSATKTTRQRHCKPRNGTWTESQQRQRCGHHKLTETEPQRRNKNHATAHLQRYNNAGETQRHGLTSVTTKKHWQLESG